MGNKNLLRLFTTAICLLLLLLFYHDVIFNLNSYYFGLEGDGLKNYYFVKYYINDAAAQPLQFTGMNYPFGENLNYLDAQPLTTVMFKWINIHFTNTGDAFVPTTYILFFISILITGLIMLEIFFEYGISNWFAVLFACSITLLSPQIQRITVHIYLSYIFVLPAIWLMYLKFKKSQSTFIAIALVSTSIVVGFLHPYYTPIAVALLFLLILFDSDLKPNQKFKCIIVFTIVPVLIFRLLLMIGYHGAEDFAQHPYGAFGEAYRSRPEDVFFPNVSSLWNKWFHLNWIAHASYEGEAFLGWGLSITGICFIIYMIVKSIYKRSFVEFNPFKTNSSLFFSACIIFVFSAGALHFILPLTVQNTIPSFITQFRSYGRLVWIIYYLLAVFFALTFYKLVLREKFKSIQLILTTVFVTLCIADVFEMNTRVSRHFEERKKSIADYSVFDLTKNINAGNYQAIISLPYFHLISTIPGEREPQPNQMWNAFQLSLKTGLPLTDTYSSRSSQKIARLQLDYYANKDKSVLNFYQNKKPLLIIVSINDSVKIMNHSIDKSELYPREIELLNRGKLIGQTEKLLLFEIKFEDL